MDGNAEAMEDLKRILAAREPLYAQGRRGRRHHRRRRRRMPRGARRSVARAGARDAPPRGAPDGRRPPRAQRPRRRRSSPTTRTRTATGTGSSRRRRDRDARDGRRRGRRRSRPATSSSSTATTSASTSSSPTRPAPPLRAPRGARVVVTERARTAIFCSGANIFMLGLSTHAFKVNFCKFTNETRLGIEDASRALRAQVRRGVQRHDRRRRLRARARLRRDPAGRRRQLAR